MMVATAKSILFFLGVGIFGAIAVVVAVVGEGEERLIGISLALLFGAGMAAVAVHRWSRPASETIRAEAIYFRGASRDALVCHHSRRKHWVAFVGSSASAAAGVLWWIAADAVADDRLTRWLLGACGLTVAALFSGRVLYDLYTRWGADRYVALLPEGIVRQGVSPIFIPWEAVEAAGAFEWQRTRAAGVRLSAPGSVDAPWWARQAMPLNRAIYGFDVTFADLEASADDLAEAIQRQLSSVRETRYGASLPVG